MDDTLAMALDERKAARTIDCSPRTLQRWRLEGRGPAFVKLGKKVLYLREDLVRYLQTHRHSPAA